MNSKRHDNDEDSLSDEQKYDKDTIERIRADRIASGSYTEPCSIVWTTLPGLNCVFPWIGHTGMTEYLILSNS